MRDLHSVGCDAEAVARILRTAVALPITSEGSATMLHYAIVFFVIALVAAVFGFGGIAAGAVEIGKILFFVFLVVAVVTFVMSLLRKP